jgi:hypothetical protein
MTESITLDASSTGVFEVLEGPPDDALDNVEATKFVEAQLRCDLLRAHIHSVQRDEELRDLIVKRSVLRIDCILVVTMLAIGWVALFATSSHPLLLRGLIIVLGVTTMATARTSHFLLQ